MGRKRRNYFGEAKVGAKTARKPTRCVRCGLDKYLNADGLCFSCQGEIDETASSTTASLPTLDGNGAARLHDLRLIQNSDGVDGSDPNH